MNYPAIISVGLGYSIGDIDIAVDYRNVDYANADGFSKTGWTPTASVLGLIGFRFIVKREKMATYSE